jgi:uncharacterized protein YggE
MMKICLLAILLVPAPIAAPAFAQQPTSITQPIAGTRLDISATGEATRVPDVANISAGVITRAATARAALEQNAARMDRVRASLKRAGIADRDIQTSNISLNPEYRYVQDQPPRLNGYTASNQVNVRFRDIAKSGDILDALVAEGANSINGPSLTIDKPDEALDEAPNQGAWRRPCSRRDLCSRARHARCTPGIGQRRRRKLPGAAADACHDGGPSAGRRCDQDRSGRAEGSVEPGDGVRAAVNRKGRPEDRTAFKECISFSVSGRFLGE